MDGRFLLGLLVGFLLGVLATIIAAFLWFVPVRSTTTPATHGGPAVVLQHVAANAQVESERPGDDALRLAERLLGYWGDPAHSRTELIPGALPDELGVELPIPAVAELIGSLARYERDELAHVQVVLDGHGDAHRLAEAFGAAFEASAWSWRREPQPGGFVSTAGWANGQACDPDTGTFAYVNITSFADRPSDVRVDVQPVTSAMPGGPCPQFADASIPYPPQAPLPVLRAPADVALQPQNTSYFEDQASSSALVSGVTAVGALAEHYANELAAAGWQREVASGDEGFVRSGWTLVDEQGVRWHGLFTAAAVPGVEGRIALHFVMVAQ